MSIKEFLALVMFFLCFLLLGASIFYYVELPAEKRAREIERQQRDEIQDLLQKHYDNGIAKSQAEILEKLNEYCGKPFAFSTNNGTAIVTDNLDERPYIWNFYNCVLFVLYTVTTVGYGTIAPKTRHGRMIDVAYGLVGIPLTGIVMYQMSEYYGAVFDRAFKRRKEFYENNFQFFMDILRYLIPGIVIFFLIPAGFFSILEEDWYYDTGIYYAFITLTTVGYGDLVAGQLPIKTVEYEVYKIMILLWIFLGVGYMVMVVAMITKGMKSKRVRNVEKKLASAIKQTQNKIWREFAHEYSSVRRMMNEMYLLKIKPVYKHELEVRHFLSGNRRSLSAPNLTEWPVLRKREDSLLEDEDEGQQTYNQSRMNRRRAFSQNVIHPKLQRVMSDGDLSHIDRNATFGAAGTNREPNALLARVVDALGVPIGSKYSLADDEYDTKYSKKQLKGVHGFSDAEVLASEKWPEQRSRTHSMSSPTFKRFSVSDEHRTWSGMNYQDTYDLMMMRENGNVIKMDSNPIKSSKASIEDQQQPPKSTVRRMSMAVNNFFNPSNKTKPLERKDSKKKQRGGQAEETPESMLEQINYLSHTSGRRASMFSALTNELAPTGPDGTVPFSPILENTSVADFLRLISSLQSRLDPNLPLTQDSLNTTKSNMAKETPLSSLFTQSRPSNEQSESIQNPKDSLSVPESILRRRLSINPTNKSLWLRNRLPSERRFSLIPPMDVDHPSSQRKSFYDVVKERYASQSRLPGDDDKSITSPINQRLRRMSLSGSARYISSKIQNRDGIRSSKRSNFANSQNRRKFSIHPVESVTNNSDQSPSNIAIGSTNNKNTIDSKLNEDQDRKMSTDSLEDVVVVRL
uniref:Potassium channel domain-containing protein n=1 Tax=Clastoptera arizonana TaxID=38151 RepID=A0A1B6EBI3_9HEMI